MIKDMEKGQSIQCLQESQVPETREKVWSKEDLPLMDKDEFKEHLARPDIFKSMEPVEMHP